MPVIQAGVATLATSSTVSTRAAAPLQTVEQSKERNGEAT